MSLQLTRLEIKDILANLGPDAEPEVRAKLQAMLGVPSSPIASAVPPPPTPDTVQAPFHEGSKPPKPDGPVLMTWDDIPPGLRWIEGKSKNEDRDKLFAQSDLDQINNERVMSWNAMQKMKAAVSYEPFIHPLIDPRAGTFNVAVGERNRAGDPCVLLAADGTSVFQCPEGHGYVSNNPAVPGCTECAVHGNLTSQREEAGVGGRRDPGAIEGEDSAW
jgi:hypothetical protein